MTDAALMDAPCIHGVVWWDCVRCQLDMAIQLARDAGLDVEAIMADELRDMGYVVVRGVIDMPDLDEYEDEHEESET